MCQSFVSLLGRLLIGIEVNLNYINQFTVCKFMFRDESVDIGSVWPKMKLSNWFLA